MTYITLLMVMLAALLLPFVVGYESCEVDLMKRISGFGQLDFMKQDIRLGWNTAFVTFKIFIYDEYQIN